MSQEVTLGVSVAIPPPHATVLANWRRQVGDANADLVWPHVTLLPPTPVPAELLTDVEEHLRSAALAQEPFAMHLAGTGTFRPTSPVVFIQVATGVSQCEILEQAIRRGPLERELDFPYHPHVTVAHLDDQVLLDRAFDGLVGFDCAFVVTAFHLYVHDPDRGWKATRDFVLTGAAD